MSSLMNKFAAVLLLMGGASLVAPRSTLARGGHGGGGSHSQTRAVGSTRTANATIHYSNGTSANMLTVENANTPISSGASGSGGAVLGSGYHPRSWVAKHGQLPIVDAVDTSSTPSVRGHLPGPTGGKTKISSLAQNGWLPPVTAVVTGPVTGGHPHPIPLADKSWVAWHGHLPKVNTLDPGTSSVALAGSKPIVGHTTATSTNVMDFVSDIGNAASSAVGAVVGDVENVVGTAGTDALDYSGQRDHRSGRTQRKRAHEWFTRPISGWRSHGELFDRRSTINQGDHCRNLGAHPGEEDAFGVRKIATQCQAGW